MAAFNVINPARRAETSSSVSDVLGVWGHNMTSSIDDEDNVIAYSQDLLFKLDRAMYSGSHTQTDFTGSFSRILREAGWRNLPPAILEDLKDHDYKTGVMSSPLKFFMTNFTGRKLRFLQNIVQDLYFHAQKKGDERLIWNILVILSELPYEMLGKWAAAVAHSALSNPREDIAELAVRCFENWEDKEACNDFLKNFKFRDAEWLQEYADEVCEYVETEGKEHKKIFMEWWPQQPYLANFKRSVSNGVSENDYPWQMGASRETTTVN